MTPDGVSLKIDVITWSDEESRAAVVAALNGDDPGSALGQLTTVGYVWAGDSAVGYSLKYAHRARAGDRERITFVTDRRLGSFQFRPWSRDGNADTEQREYSVIELYLDDEGRGVGTLSLAADIVIDGDGRTVGLSESDSQVLIDAQQEPKPYWAQDS